MNRIELTRVFEGWAAKMAANRDYLIELDSVVGDGDLGLTMSDGFAAAAASVKENPETDLGKVIYFAGKAMSQAVPSTMGTLMASGLMNAGKFAKGKTSLNLIEFADLMEAYFQGVKNLGKAELGDKTILDGLAPAITALKENAAAGKAWKDALDAAAAAAQKGYENTTTMVAVHGRAATRGENSRSLLDPGAAVAMLLMQALAELSGEFS